MRAWMILCVCVGSLGCVGLLACDPDSSSPVLASGVFAPLGEVLPAASDAQKDAFARGRALALQRFTPAQGLGPTFNVSFCAGCHEKPTFGGGAGRYRDFLIVQQKVGGLAFDLGVNGVQPQFTLAPAVREPTHANANFFAKRNPMPFFGVGLLAEIPEAEILRHADPDDQDGDGISGRPNYDRGFVGRFGRKAQTVSLEGFVRGPLFNHLGITSNPLSQARKALLPVASANVAASSAAASSTAVTSTAVTQAVQSQRRTVGSVSMAQAAAPESPIMDNDGVPDPELSEDALFDLVSFVMLLAAPERDPVTSVSRAGEVLFDAMNCTGCHVPALHGPRGLIPAYSDLLLHDMGSELADELDTMGVAGSREFRTQPLWGVAAVAPYLHDGRADTLEEAILAHGGEAQQSRTRYEQLTAEDRTTVLAFLASLGGQAQKTAGLLPPDAPLPEVGALGGPRQALSGQDHALFLQGRAAFDRDFRVTEGLGTQFNGDACRACHFEPTIGGAGPVGVDVIRYGRVENGLFTAPTESTIAHRHLLWAERPALDASLNANVFEARQTPALFGLGLVAQIPEATILMREDPNDANADGISGRAHVLSDGRLGRFGWKADVPSLREFVRDAMSAELGITLPDEAGQTFGVGMDNDDIADPELTLNQIDAVVFFMAELAPPPRVRTNETEEDAGDALFVDVGCTHCHTPTLTTENGTDVALYSDLLLHDVAPLNAVGVVSGAASMREFRTPLLWGLGRTAPYMHDGRAFTIEDAIARHHTEAAAARAAYDLLSMQEQTQLLAFLRSL